MKTISMPYEDYLADIEKARSEAEHKLRGPLLDLCSVDISRNHLGRSEVKWKYQGTREQLLDEICKIMGVLTFDESQQELEKRARREVRYV